LVLVESRLTTNSNEGAVAAGRAAKPAARLFTAFLIEALKSGQDKRN
jgi:hypothetical protein